MFDNISAIVNIQKIKKGETKKLSKSQIVNAIISTMEAKKNLDPVEYEKVWNLYLEYNKEKTKIEMNFDNYLQVSSEILVAFNEIAPWDLYCSGV